MIVLIQNRIQKVIGFLEVTIDSAQLLSYPFSKRYHAGAGIRIKDSVFILQGRLSNEVRFNLISEMREYL